MPVKKPTKATAKPSASAPVAKRPTQSSVQTPPASRPAPKRVVKPTAIPSSPVPSTPCAPSPAVLRPGSKQAQLLGLLDTGATMTQMSKLTGWQAHTIRATISVVFRKRLGLSIEPRTAPGGTERIYQVTALAA